MKKKDIDLIKEIHADFIKRKEARRSLESNWLLNINFFCGNQFAEILPGGEIRDEGKDYYWQSRDVYNHIAPIIETRLAKFASIGAGVSVRPATSDFDDVKAAKFSTLLLKSVEEENDFKKLTGEATFWSEICGTSFYKVGWAKNKGKRLSDTVSEGDIDVTVCPPYEIYPDNLGASDVDECQSIIHARAYPVERIKEVWGVEVKGEDVSVISSENIGGNGKNGYFSDVTSKVLSDHAVVIERYSLPDANNPKGRLTIVAGDKLLYDGELPYENGENNTYGFPFIRQVCLERPASFFGASIIERLIPVQRAYNAIKNRKHEYLNRMAMGVLMVEDGSVDVDEIAEEGLAPGKIVIYRQGSNIPMMLNMGGVPNEFSEEESRLLNEFVTVSGVSDFLTSSVIKSSNMSGIALNLIIEQDNNRLSVTTGSIKSAIKKVGKHILRLYRQFATAKRLKRISGENGEIEMRKFSGSEITSDDLIFDVENETVGSAANRKAIAEELYKMGVFFDENGKLSDVNKQRIMEIMGFGNWESAQKLEDLHVKRAERENQELNEKVPEAEDTDNHSLHVAEHIRYLIGSEKELTDIEKKRLCEHIRTHRVFDRLTKVADSMNIQ